MDIFSLIVLHFTAEVEGGRDALHILDSDVANVVPYFFAVACFSQKPIFFANCFLSHFGTLLMDAK